MDFIATPVSKFNLKLTVNLFFFVLSMRSKCCCQLPQSGNKESCNPETIKIIAFGKSNVS